MVKLFSRTKCMQCKMTHKWLEEHNIKFEETNIDEEPSVLEQLKEQGFMQTPVVIVKDKSWTGFRPEMLKTLI